MSNIKYKMSNELGAAATKRNSAHMLPVSDWLSDLPENTQLTDLIEVQKTRLSIGVSVLSRISMLRTGLTCIM